MAVMEIDRMGRRPLLVWGIVGTGLSLRGLGTAFRTTPPGGRILSYVGCFALSLWLYASSCSATVVCVVARSRDKTGKERQFRVRARDKEIHVYYSDAG